MRNLLIFGLIFVLCISLASAIDISDCNGLQDVESDLSASYRVINSFDCSGVDFVSISAFTGTFDGGSFVISNLFINGTGLGQVGLFAYTDGAVINNTFLKNVDIIGGGSTGALVGESSNTVITNCYATGIISDADGAGGGLIGQLYGGILSLSYAAIDISGSGATGGLVGTSQAGIVSECFASGNVFGTNDVGGLVADNYGIINNSYATGSVGGGDEVGGLVGDNTAGTIINSYAIGPISSNGDVGGLVGLDQFDGVVNDSFWDVDSTGVNSSLGGVGLRSSKMKDKLSFNRWNFVSKWDLKCDYPRLKHFKNTVDKCPKGDNTQFILDSEGVVVGVVNHGIVTMYNTTTTTAIISINDQSFSVGQWFKELFRGWFE